MKWSLYLSHLHPFRNRIRKNQAFGLGFSRSAKIPEPNSKKSHPTYIKEGWKMASIKKYRGKKGIAKKSATRGRTKVAETFACYEPAFTVDYCGCMRPRICCWSILKERQVHFWACLWFLLHFVVSPQNTKARVRPWLLSFPHPLRRRLLPKSDPIVFKLINSKYLSVAHPPYIPSPKAFTSARNCSKKIISLSFPNLFTRRGKKNEEETCELGRMVHGHRDVLIWNYPKGRGGLFALWGHWPIADG